MSRAIGFWPFGQKQQECTTSGPSPLVGNTAKNAQNGQNYTKACLFSRPLLRSGHSSHSSPLPSLAHSWRSVPDLQPQVAESRGFGRTRPKLADRSSFKTAIGCLGTPSSDVSGETSQYLRLCSLDLGRIY